MTNLYNNYRLRTVHYGEFRRHYKLGYFWVSFRRLLGGNFHANLATRWPTVCLSLSVSSGLPLSLSLSLVPCTSVCFGSTRVQTSSRSPYKQKRSGLHRPACSVLLEPNASQKSSQSHSKRQNLSCRIDLQTHAGNASVTMTFEPGVNACRWPTMYYTACVPKKYTTQPLTIILTTVVQFQ